MARSKYEFRLEGKRLYWCTHLYGGSLGWKHGILKQGFIIQLEIKPYFGSNIHYQKTFNDAKN